MKNFTNGALVFRLWHFDGSGEVIGKFQYMSHAVAFSRMMADEDAKTRPGDASKWFYLAACDADCDVRAFNPIKPEPAT